MNTETSFSFFTGSALVPHAYAWVRCCFSQRMPLSTPDPTEPKGPTSPKARDFSDFFNFSTAKSPKGFWPSSSSSSFLSSLSVFRIGLDFVRWRLPFGPEVLPVIPAAAPLPDDSLHLSTVHRREVNGFLFA